MYVNRKMRPVDPGRREIKKNYGEGEFNYDIL
jgi:hypothetical protein